MGTISIIIIILSIAGIGFGSGMHLGLIDDSAAMYKIQNLIPKNISLSQGLPLFELAFMSGQSNGLISHATVGFGLGSVVIDPDENPNNGDEYFDNRITECEFHSDEDIDEPICIVCKLKDTHDECVDKWLGFTEFEHGTLLSNDQGFPNAVIPGVTITAVANTGGKNAVMIYDGDTLGGFGEGTTPDPDLRADADCPGCAGLHIAVIAENTGGGADGIVDIPDDNANGGTQTWVFDQPWFVSTFDFVDYDRNYDGEARAYDNPSCSGTPVATAAISKTPNGGNGSVQTITLNANNVRCLEFEYEDSGGVTNIHLECIQKHNTNDVIAVGILNLPDGYTASTVVPVPLEDGGVDVFKVQSVQIAIAQSVIDFAGLSHGESFAAVKGYLQSNFGITLEIDGFNGIDEATIYNSFNVGGADPDLEHPLNPDDQSVGNLLIMKENSGNQPNDSAAGGIIRFKSVEPISYGSIDVVDHDNNGNTSEIRSYSNFDCTGLIDTSDIVADGNNNLQTVQINDANVRCLEIYYKDSGGFTNIILGCVDKFREPCVDRWLSFTEFEHGTLLSNDQGYPNAVIPGVTITAVANPGGKNAAMIFDGDTPGDADENPTPDPDLRASGVCPGCAGKHIVVIAENTAGGADGIVDVPDDNAEGGMQTWVFDVPWYLKSFDFVDYDRNYDGEARAYDNPSCSGTPVATVQISQTPNGGDGSVQTITMNADNVRCLEVEYADSGGITNMHLECIGKVHEQEKVEFFYDSFEDEDTIWNVWYKDNGRTTTPHPDRIWFGQASAGEIGAHSGTYYLGGSGNIDDLDDVDNDGVTNPAWAAKNRDIDISQHTDIWLSFWYSYDNTESNDEFAMYYSVDGGAWQQIFLIDPTTQSNQQVPWQFVEIGIPDGNEVKIQFRWETSAGSGDDIVMIDDLKLSGVPN